MDIQKIIALVAFRPTDSDGGGTHGAECIYASNKSVEQYVKDFTDEVKKANSTENVRVNWLRITEHNSDGSYKRDENGRRVEKFIYRNDAAYLARLANL